MVDMVKAEEQLRGASDLMLELQQRLAEAQPQAYPRPTVHPHGAPSRLPRENFPEETEASAYEEQWDMSVPPGKGATKHFTAAWAAEPEMLPAGNPRLETRAGGVSAGRNPGGAPRVADYEWQGGQRGQGGHGEAAEVRGSVEAGGDREQRTQVFRFCDAGRTRGDVAAAASAETALSPRPGSFLPLSIEVRTYTKL